MPRPKKPHRPFWADEERLQNSESPRFILNALRTQQTQSSREGEALIFDGVNSLGQLTFKRVPYRYPRRGR